MTTKQIDSRCKVCKHEEVDRINARLVAGASGREVGGEYGMSYKSVINHKNKHLPKQLVKAQELQDEQSADKLLQQVNELYEKALIFVEKADSDRQWQAATGALKEARSCLELTAKMIGTLKTGHTTNIVYNTEFVQARVAIYEALQPYPDARQAVIAALEKGDIIDAEYTSVDNT